MSIAPVNLSLEAPFEEEELTQEMDETDDTPKSSGMFWDISGLRQIVVDYLDPKTAETAANFFAPQKAFETFQNTLKTRTYAEMDCIAYICSRFSTEQNPLQLICIIKTHLPALKVLNFATFPDPASTVLELSRDPLTALILAHSIAYLSEFNGENVRRILANKIVSTLTHTGTIKTVSGRSLSEVREQISGKRKSSVLLDRSQSLLEPVQKKSRSRR